jgi:hypothetical protein
MPGSSTGSLLEALPGESCFEACSDGQEIQSHADEPLAALKQPWMELEQSVERVRLSRLRTFVKH